MASQPVVARHGKRPKLVTWTIGVALLVATGSIPAPAQSGKDPQNRKLVVRVVERTTNAPIAGAAVNVELDSGARDGLGGDARVMASLVTGKNGECEVEFPRTLPRRIYVTASQPGYANRTYEPLIEPGGRAIPRRHTLELERGVSIGGIVKGEGGPPVAGATVTVMARAGLDAAADFSYVPEVKVTTDAQGRWRFDAMPTGWSFVALRVAHPDYVPTIMMRIRPRPTDFDLKAKRAVTILEPGVRVHGQVRDDRGQPIAGATVGLGSDRHAAQHGFPTAMTDQEGRFHFDHVPTGTQTITAQAPRRCPALAEFVVAPDMKPVEFRLKPGHLIRGRVVDRSGKPIEGVAVQPMNWKTHSSLDWRATTDRDGRFTWDSAPAETVRLTLTRPGYVMISQREFRPGPAETPVTMYPPLFVRGEVRDARSGQPIPRFHVVDGAYYRFANEGGQLRQVNWERGGPAREFMGGQYEVEYAHPLVKAVAVRIEAVGYQPVTSEPFRMEAGDVTFDATVEPGSGPTGMVHGRDGQPLAGASVILSTKSLRAQLHNGTFHEGGYPLAVTEADGRFAFQPQTEPFRVFVDHATGFAQADEKALAASPTLTVHPWGRVEGLVKIGAKPAAGVQVRLSQSDDPRWDRDSALPITQAQQLATDARGHYAFEHVMPGRLTVSRIFVLERSSAHVGTGDRRTVIVKPEQTTWVDLGGVGRPVIGRFVLPAGIRKDAVFPYYFQTLERIQPEPPYPPVLDAKGRDAWLAEWLTTDAGESYSRAQRIYDTNVRLDGRFRVEDVEPGRYRLQAEVHAPGNGFPGSYGPELASVSKVITVPQIPGRRSDEPLDLGTMELKPKR
jgi:protocatechuate 3,4-dioxygenase beta subunit